MLLYHLQPRCGPFRSQTWNVSYLLLKAHIEAVELGVDVQSAGGVVSVSHAGLSLPASADVGLRLGEIPEIDECITLRELHTYLVS